MVAASDLRSANWLVLLKLMQTGQPSGATWSIDTITPGKQPISSNFKAISSSLNDSIRADLPKPMSAKLADLIISEVIYLDSLQITTQT